MLPQKKEGKKVNQIWQPLCCHVPKKSLNGLIDSTWELQNAKATIKREEISRMLVLEKARLSSCVHDCYMECYICLRDILQKNSINPYTYIDR